MLFQSRSNIGYGAKINYPPGGGILILLALLKKCRRRKNSEMSQFEINPIITQP